MLKKVIIDKIEKEGGRGDQGRAYVVFLQLVGKDRKRVEHVINVPLSQVKNVIATTTLLPADALKVLIQRAAEDWYSAIGKSPKEEPMTYDKEGIIKLLGSNEITIS